jgi:hypothetical protein
MIALLALWVTCSCNKLDNRASSLSTIDRQTPRDHAVAKLNEIVFPVVHFEAVPLEEAVDWISQRGRELNSEVFDEFASASPLNKKARQAELAKQAKDKEGVIRSALESDSKIDDRSQFSTVTFDAKDIKLLDLIAEVAERAKADAFLSSEGIIITREGTDPIRERSDLKVWKVIRKATGTPH